MSLRVEALSFDYYEKAILQNVEFSLARGQILHLRGPNGAGKTTLLRLLAGILEPSSGAIIHDDQPIHLKLAAYQQNLCYLGHKLGLNALLTVEENCYFDPHWQKRVMSLPALLESFHLEAQRTQPCYQLSAGQQRRLALLRLIMTDAAIWLLDEPFVALDTASIALLTTHLTEHLQAGGLIVISSHQPLPPELEGCQVYCL